MIKTAAQCDHTFVSTGGGAVLDPDNRRFMKNSGQIIWLKARLETIRHRMEKDRETSEYRPSLTGGDHLEEMKSIMLKRDPIYRDTMDFSVDTDNCDIDDICVKIIKWWEMGKPADRVR